MNVRFYCPDCETAMRATLPGTAEQVCSGCDRLALLPGTGSVPLTACAACGNADLYRKKDFPHTLGMAILVFACLGSTLTYWLYDKWLTWAILLGSAAFDTLLYLWVKDVVVCYRCHAEHRGLGAEAARHAPFELTIHERYRQEKLRHEQLR